MSASFNKAAMSAAATVVVLVLTSAAPAAVSPGYPKGRPYFGSENQGSARSYRGYARAYSAPAETRQSFSYEPSESGASQDHAKSSGGCCCGGRTAGRSETTDDVAANTDQTRRSYSYEPESQPTTQWRTYNRRSTTVLDPWQYQKTDPRRMGR